MAAFVSATALYTVNQTSGTLTDLQFAIDKAQLPMDPSIANLLSCSILTDTSASGGTAATRTQVTSLVLPPLLTTPWNNRETAANGTLTVFSTSDKDTFSTGTGLQEIRFTFADASTVNVNLQGKTKVTFSNANHGGIAGYTPVALGSLGANAGNIIVLGAPMTGGTTANPRGTNDPRTGQPMTPPIVSIPSCFYTIFPDATSHGIQFKMFRQWIYNQMVQQVGPIVWSNPAMA